MHHVKKAAGLGILAACIGGVICYKCAIRMSMKEYTRYALIMAVMDDEICRNELEGNRIDGEEIQFPPRAESLQQRYHMFLEWNRGKSRKAIRMELTELERRLEESRQYQSQPKGSLEVSFLEPGFENDQ